jgi:hypothetical protein
MFNKIKISQIPAVWFFLILIFILGTAYFVTAGSYLLSFQKEQYLFVFSLDYLKEFFLRPGGLLVLSGKFLTQFYSFNLPGSILISGTVILPGIMLLKISRALNLNMKNELILPIIASCLMFLMQTHYYHLMEYNLGYISVLLIFGISINLTKKGRQWILLVIFPLFCYISGGAFALLFLCLYLIYLLSYEKCIRNFIYYLSLLAVGGAAFLVFKKFIFLLPVNKLLFDPAPLLKDKFHMAVFFIFSSFILIYPLLVKVINGSSLNKKLKSGLLPFTAASLVVLFTAAITYKVFNPQTARVVNIEQLAYDGKWNDLITYHEKYPSENLIGQYFYNVALSETGQLCERLFQGRQDFRESALILPWSDDYLSWGAYFFYSTGLVNEAHRWAYEEMVVYNCRPHNLLMMARTDLISGNYRMAEKYLGILRNTIYYRDQAEEYEKCIRDTSLIESYPDLKGMKKIVPKKNFYVYLESPEGNLPVIFESNHQNKTSFEYMMAYLMLTKNVESVMNNVKLMQGLGYRNIPRNVEEAVMIYYNSTKQIPDMGGLTISPATQDRFNAYFKAYLEARKDPSTMKEKMKPFSNTFWYYYHFS